MKNTTVINIIFTLILFSLVFSCIEKKAAKIETKDSVYINPSKKDSLTFTSGIRSIFQDSQGNYWLGSHQEGVAKYDGKSFEYFTTREGLSGNQVRTIQGDNKGNIWFGTGSGVSSFNGNEITNHTQNQGIDTLNEWTKTENDLWFNAGNQAGVFKYNGAQLQYLPFPSLKTLNQNNAYFVTCFSEGKNDIIWAGTYAGVIGYDGHNFTVINDETLAFNDAGDLMHVRSILEDSKGRLWIGNNGIGVLLKEKNTIINFSEKNNLIHPASSKSGSKSPAGTLEHVFAIAEDKDGNIWFGDRDTGAWKYDGKTVVNYTIDPTLSSPMVWSIYNDKEGNLLFGMADKGVYKFNGDSFDRMF